MQWFINGQHHDFVEIKAFRQQFNLPESFGVAHFEPKDYSGLGRIDGAGAQLNELREEVLEVIPDELDISQLIEFVDQLGFFFRVKLHAINDSIWLDHEQIEFAVAGFCDVLQAVAYALMRAKSTHSAMPSFKQIYGEWLMGGLRASAASYSYTHDGDTWRVNTIIHVYGRFGLVVTRGGQVHYVQDAVYGCPAEGFMGALLNEVAGRMVSIVK